MREVIPNAKTSFFKAILMFCTAYKDIRYALFKDSTSKKSEVKGFEDFKDLDTITPAEYVKMEFLKLK